MADPELSTINISKPGQSSNRAIDTKRPRKRSKSKLKNNKQSIITKIILKKRKIIKRTITMNNKNKNNKKNKKGTIRTIKIGKSLKQEGSSGEKDCHQSRSAARQER